MIKNPVCNDCGLKTVIVYSSGSLHKPQRHDGKVNYSSSFEAKSFQ